jgi:hypothetical protein
MTRGRRRHRLVLALGAGLAFALGAALAPGLPGCYDVPRPDCGFRCGPDQACPEGYTCAAEGRCHRNGSPPSLVCGTVDAAIDGPIDGAPRDGAIDAMVDAAPDAMVDAMVDAM